MKKYKTFTQLFIVIIFGLSIISVQGQTHDEHNTNPTEFKHFRAAIAIGHGHIPTASKEGTSFLVLPSWGVDLQYWFNEKWAFGFKGDLEIANYIIEDKEGKNQLERENPIILTTPVFYSPWEQNGWVFFMGPGVELEGDHNFFIWRTGVSYEIHLPKAWDFAPEIIYDLKGGYVNSFTIAFGVGKKF